MIKLKNLLILFSAITAMLFFYGCQTTTRNNDKTLIDIIKHFDECGLRAKIIQPIYAKPIKATDGCQLTINGANIEIYRYDVNNEEQREFLEDIIKKGYIDILTVKFEARVNGSFVLLHGNEHPDSAAILQAFDSF